MQLVEITHSQRMHGALQTPFLPMQAACKATAALQLYRSRGGGIPPRHASIPASAGDAVPRNYAFAAVYARVLTYRSFIGTIVGVLEYL